MSHDTVFIGMDLGTFKTSVSCSNGRRAVIHSAVGWPRDQVARSLMGRDVVFGDELRERRLALDIVRPFERGVLKYMDAASVEMSPQQVARHKEAARLLVAHAVSLVCPERPHTILGVIGAPSRAKVGNKEFILEAARDTFDAIAIVPEPFAAAYGMNRIADTLVVDIGAGTIDICPLHGTFPTEESQATIALGGDAVDDRLMRSIAAAYPQARVSKPMVRDIKEQHGLVEDANQRIKVTLPTSGRPQAFDLTDQLREACQSLVGPIVDAIREVVGKYDPEFQETLLNNVLLAGGGSQIKGLDQLLEKSLEELGGGKVRKVFDYVFAGATGALMLAMDMPGTHWDQLAGQNRPLAVA